MIRSSRVAFVIRVFAAFALSVVAMICCSRGAETGKIAGKVWGTAVEGQTLSITSDKAAYAPGEAIILNVCFKNVGKTNVKVAGASVIRLYHLDLLLPDGKAAPLTLYGRWGGDRHGSMELTTLTPGDETSSELDLSQHFDMTLAGTYAVTLERRVWKDDGLSPTLKAKSNTLKITVDDSLLREAASATPEGGKAAGKTWGSAVEGQAVSIAADKAAYDMGEPVTLRICFKNAGQQDVKAARKDPLRTYLLTVLDSDGKPAQLTLYGKEAIKPDGVKNLEKLAPGEETSDELKLNRLFDLTLAGDYTVSVQRPVWKDGALSSTLKATSNKLRIKK